VCMTRIKRSRGERNTDFSAEFTCGGTTQSLLRQGMTPSTKTHLGVRRSCIGFQKLAKKDVSPESLFKGLDIDGDGNLNRPELKRVLTTLLPDISNPEITAIFDMIDQDKSGEVSIPELCGALNKQGREASGPPEHANRWRNPIHRINRFPPGKIEGWDHLEGPCQTERLDRLCDRQTSEIMSRLGESLVTTPRAVQHQNKTPKYLYFGGGAGIGVDSSRFRRREWEQQRSKTGEVPKLTVPEVGTPTRPGWLCEPGSSLVSKGLVAPSVASSARLGLPYIITV